MLRTPEKGIARCSCVLLLSFSTRSLKQPEEPYVIPRVLFAFHILNSSLVIFYNVLILIPVVYSNNLNDAAVYRDWLIAHGEFYKNKTAMHSRLPYQELNEYFDA